MDQLLPTEYQPGIERKMIAAYAMAEKLMLADRWIRSIENWKRINPSAARSLEEGMEETLTIHKLRMPEMLRKSLASTDIIKSAFSVAEAGLDESLDSGPRCERMNVWSCVCTTHAAMR